MLNISLWSKAKNVVWDLQWNKKQDLYKNIKRLNSTYCNRKRDDVFSNTLINYKNLLSELHGELLSCFFRL
jgi:hypothetical protein